MDRFEDTLDRPVVAQASAAKTPADGWFEGLGCHLVPYRKVRQRWVSEESEFDKLFDEMDDFADCYPWLTDATVHAGSVHVPGDLYLNAEAGIYVIDGDLTVDGVLRYYDVYEYGLLAVTGDLRARHILVEWHSRLLVLGSVHLDGILFWNGSDAAQVEIRGTTTADACIVGGDFGVGFGRPPNLTYESATVIPELSESATALYEVMRTGRPVLSDPDHRKS